MLVVETPRAPLPALVRLVLQAMEQVVKVTIKLSSIDNFNMILIGTRWSCLMSRCVQNLPFSVPILVGFFNSSAKQTITLLIKDTNFEHLEFNKRQSGRNWKISCKLTPCHKLN